ncbi:serine protease inhibitor 42Dd-like [Cochliomyia hominivorax]
MAPLKNLIIWFLGCLMCLSFNNVLAKRIELPYEPANPNSFANSLFPLMSDGQSSKNIIYSPFAIQSSFALAYIGAEGQTSEDIRTAFKLGQGNKDEIIAGFGKLLQGLTSSSKPDASQFKLANRIYVNEYYRLNEEFNNKAKKYFGAQAKSIDFVKHRLAAAEINEWVEEQTTHKVKDLMKETDLGEKTTAVLVSASYFQGKWMRQFSEDKTEEGLFKVDNEQIKRVQMMHNKAHYKYADLPELEASALELPYKNSNISMLIILPKEITGLQKLEASLYNADFNDISSKMQMSNVDISLPKFHLEYEINLEQPLSKLGLSTLFSNEANFEGLFDSAEKSRISEALHKSILDVNEAGSEAASTSGSGLAQAAAGAVTGTVSYESFNADHPFFFAIRSKDAIYLTGHVSDF